MHAPVYTEEIATDAEGAHALLAAAYGEGRMVGLTPVSEDKGIPGTWQMVDSWSGTSFDGDSQLMTERQLHYTVGTDLDRPFVVYCHNSGCFMSYNVVLRAAKLGYRNIYWLRGGIDEWRAKGGAVIGRLRDGCRKRCRGGETLHVVRPVRSEGGGGCVRCRAVRRGP